MAQVTVTTPEIVNCYDWPLLGFWQRQRQLVQARVKAMMDEGGASLPSSEPTSLESSVTPTLQRSRGGRPRIISDQGLPELEEKIRALRAERPGVTTKEIAYLLKINRRTLYRVLARRGTSASRSCDITAPK